MRAYLDTNVLVSIVMREPGWIRRERWLAAAASERIFSRFAWGEFIDTVARSVRRRETTRADAEGLIDGVTLYVERWTMVKLDDEDVAQAAQFIRRDFGRALKLADAFHLAAARRVSATLVTGDRQLASAAAAFEIGHHFLDPSPES